MTSSSWLSWLLLSRRRSHGSSGTALLLLRLARTPLIPCHPVWPLRTLWLQKGKEGSVLLLTSSSASSGRSKSCQAAERGCTFEEPGLRKRIWHNRKSLRPYFIGHYRSHSKFIREARLCQNPNRCQLSDLRVPFFVLARSEFRPWSILPLLIP